MATPARSSLRFATTVLLNATLYALAVLAVVPFAWMICAAFKREQDLFSPAFLPWHDLGTLSLDNFRELFRREPFARWMLNSLFVSSAYTVLVVCLSSLGGFALAKYRFRGRRPLMLLMLITLLLPGQVLLPGSYRVMFAFGWLNSYLALIIPGAVSVFGTFLFMQAMKSVPDELLQAARVDGCSELRVWWDIALPAVRPMLAAFTLLSFMTAWNSYLWPNIVLQDASKFTLPIGLAGMLGLSEFQGHLGPLMAGTLLAILPVAVLFFALQKDFIAGLTSGAIKG